MTPNETFELLNSNITSPEQRAQFSFLMRQWRRKQFAKKIDKMTLSQKKVFVNKWLAELENIFKGQTSKINVLGGMKGFLASGNASKKVFVETYNATIEALSSFDKTFARKQRNLLALKIKKKGIKKLYKEFDDFLIEGKALGLTRNEIVKQFQNSKLGKTFSTLTGSGGRKWDPDSYARMYSSTRDSHMRNEIFVQQSVRLKSDVVQVSSHGTEDSICLEYEGKFFSLAGNTPGLPILDLYPPFHPNCKHVLLRRPGATKQEIAKTNNEKNAEIKKAKKDYTPAQKKAIKNQKEWGKENNPTVVQRGLV